jgi:hypothetical protein
MSFPVIVEQVGSEFAASLLGAPNIKAMEHTRSQAILALEEKVKHCLDSGELLSLEIETTGVSTLGGKYRNDPMLRQICEEAYEMRDNTTL